MPIKIVKSKEILTFLTFFYHFTENNCIFTDIIGNYTENFGVNKYIVGISDTAYNALDKEVARRRQAGLTASRKGVATEAIMAKYGSPATGQEENSTGGEA